MNTRKQSFKSFGILIAAIVLVLVIALLFSFEPASRNLVATDKVCSMCHVEEEYLHTASMTFTQPHPPQDSDTVEDPARCVDCHLPEGLVNSVYLYTHILSVTDLFGHFRDREGERSGDWIPLSAARAYRVRDRLLEYDSSTCRTCHVMEEIVPESVRGQTAHKDAVANQETCIECHSNLVHRFVEVRMTTGGEEEGMEEGDEFNEFDEFDEFGDDLEETTEDGLEVL